MLKESVNSLWFIEAIQTRLVINGASCSAKISGFEDFKSFIKQKAENANKSGKLTDVEIENIKQVIPDFQILKKLPSQFDKLPSQFERKFDSLKVKN